MLARRTFMASCLAGIVGAALSTGRFYGLRVDLPSRRNPFEPFPVTLIWAGHGNPRRWCDRRNWASGRLPRNGDSVFFPYDAPMAKVWCPDGLELKSIIFAGKPPKRSPLSTRPRICRPTAPPTAGPRTAHPQPEPTRRPPG